MEKKKYILYIGNFENPESNAPGKRVYGNALIFSKLGYSVRLIGKDYKVDQGIIDYNNNITFQTFPKGGILNINRYLSFIEKIVNDYGFPEIIVRYGSPGLALFDKKIISFAKQNKITLIADVVDWLPAGGTNIFFKFVKWIDTYLEKAIFNIKSDGIIAISSYLYEYYSNRGCNAIIIPPLVEKYIANTEKNKLIKIVYAGVPFRPGIKINKNSKVKDRLDLAVSSIAELINKGNPVCFDIYGLTNEEYLIAYPDHKKILDDTKGKISFHGRKEMSIVHKAINTADYTILFRDRNRATMAGFPTKVVESLSLGTPVITNDTSDLREYVINGKNGFLLEINQNIIEQLNNCIFKSTININNMKDFVFNNFCFLPENYIQSMKDFINKILI